MSKDGIEIAEKPSLDVRLDNAELIISSPYTCALQTAAIISKNINFEDLDNVFNRVKKALLNYDRYKKIIVVTHEIVMRCFSFESDIPYCRILEIDFDESYQCTEFKAH